jgi:hypothetical protein
MQTQSTYIKNDLQMENILGRNAPAVSNLTVISTSASASSAETPWPPIST